MTGPKYPRPSSARAWTATYDRSQPDPLDLQTFPDDWDDCRSERLCEHCAEPCGDETCTCDLDRLGAHPGMTRAHRIRRQLGTTGPNTGPNCDTRMLLVPKGTNGVKVTRGGLVIGTHPIPRDDKGSSYVVARIGRARSVTPTDPAQSPRTEDTRPPMTGTFARGRIMPPRRP